MLAMRRPTGADASRDAELSSWSDSRDDESASDEAQDESKALRRSPLNKGSFKGVAALEQIKRRWSLLSRYSKFAVLAIGVVFLSHTLLATLDLFFHSFGLEQLSLSNVKPATDKHYAVAINTYKRPDMLQDAVRHYGETCGKRSGINQIFIIWAEQTPDVPSPDSFFASSVRNSLKNNRPQVVVLKKKKDSLNSRFEPIPEMTSNAVFMVDDDVRVRCDGLVRAFQAWKAAPESMVGYYPRLATTPKVASSEEDASIVYHTWPVVFARHRFNFVLTKASFLHAKFLDLYTGSEYPKEIRDHVDKHMNCEDVAMSLLIANYTKYKNGSPSLPIFVEGVVDDKGLFGGISTGSGHMATRSECLTDITKIMKGHGWGAPLTHSFPLRDGAWLRHFPGFWWQYRPSNFFEWLSIGNIFT